MFGKKKKKPLISEPSNFEHRVHTGFDTNEGKYVGLPPQWASIVTAEEKRPRPLVDPSSITEFAPLKVCPKLDDVCTEYVKRAS